MKKIFKSIWNFFFKKKNKENKKYIEFYEVFNPEYIKSLLRHVIYNLRNNKGEIKPLRLSNNYVFNGNVYFAGATLCFDITVDDKPFNVVTICSKEENYSVGFFNPEWEGKTIKRAYLISPIDQEIYEDIYKITKGKHRN